MVENCDSEEGNAMTENNTQERGQTDQETTSSTADRRTFLQATGAGAGIALAGCVGLGDDEGLTIGHIAPLENPLGVGSERAAEMAVEEINDEDGGILDEEIELISKDTRAEPSEGQDAVEELIQDENADMIIGAFQSEVAAALIEITAEFDVPFWITGSADPALITDFPGDDYDEFKNVCRVSPVNTDYQAEAIADYCTYLQDRHGWTDVSFLYDNADWTDPFEEHIPDLLDERGLNIVYEDALSIEIDDLAPVVSDVEGAGTDFVLRFFAHINAGQMLGIWHEGEYEWGIEGVHVPSMMPGYHIGTEGAATYETTAQTGAGGVSPITEKTVPFVEDYADRYEDEDDPPTAAPMYMGFGTYDAIYIAREVMEEIGETEPRDHLDDFIDAFVETEYVGVAGEAQFYDSDGAYPNDLVPTRDEDDNILNYPITQWREDGSIECVYPEAYRTDHHIKPHWME